MKQKQVFKKLLGRALLLLTILHISIKSYSQEFTVEQRQSIELKIQILLKDYEQFHQLSTDGVILNEDYIKQFKLLFEIPSKTGFINDLSSSGKGSFKSPEFYVNFVKQFYPQGLDVFVDRDNINIVDIKSEQEKIKVVAYVKKKITGIYNNQKIYKFNDELCFIFTALADEKGSFTNFKINGITTKERYAQLPATSKGGSMYLGVAGMYSKTRIYNDRVYSSKVWDAKTGGAITPEINFSVMFTKNLGFGTGVRFSTYRTAFTISHYDQRSDATLTDLDGDTYQPVLNISDLTDSRTIKCIDIPFLVKYRIGMGKTKFTLDLGAVYSMFSKAYFTLKGSSVKAGYYSSYNVTLTDIPEYGFDDYSYTSNKKYDLRKPSYGLSGYANIGLLYPIKPILFLKLGMGFSFGLTPLDFNTDNPDNYFNYTLAKPADKTKLRSTGIEVGLVFRVL